MALPPHGHVLLWCLLGLADGLHVLAGGFDAHAVKGYPQIVESCPTRPESSRAVPGRRTGCPRAGARRRYEPSPEKIGRGRPRDRRAARPRLARRTTASRRGWPSFDRRRRRAARSSCRRCAGRCGCSDDASGALSVLCVVRDDEGRWLAGRRAEWVATLGRRVGARRRRRGRRRRGPRARARPRAGRGMVGRARAAGGRGADRDARATWRC